MPFLVNLRDAARRAVPCRGRRGGGQPNPDRRVYVSIKPDARGINLGKGPAESVARDRSIALIETAASDLNAGLPLLAQTHTFV